MDMGFVESKIVADLEPQACDIDIKRLQFMFNPVLLIEPERE